MGIGYTSQSVLKAGAAVTIGSSVTKQACSDVFRITAEDSLAFRADLTAASTTGTCSVMLQTSFDGSAWVDGKVVSISDGTVSVAYLPEVSGDQTYLPLRPLGRLVLTSSTTSGTTISAAIKACRL